MNGKIIFVSLLFLLTGAPVLASEITGKISTNPNYEESVVESAVPLLENNAIRPASNTSRIRVITEKKISSPPSDKNKNVLPSGKAEGEKVLGVKIYQDGTLVRGRDSKIYLIAGQAKRYIATLGELMKYAGKKIFSVSDEELSAYDERGHEDGELIRQRGDAKVYVLVMRKKKHILNLEELRSRYAGLEIFNVFASEMASYEEDKK